ncbi:MAG: carboxypeptidase regulatory-like domain-containing protein, partial [Prevotella sp.]|nr:carboxypeptidase regulatory-like domain-containing protein [Prevotella sp.]
MTKRFSYLLLMLVAILTGASNAAAQAYVVDFNTQIETNSSQTGDTNRDWKVASGWGHIVDGVEYNYSGAKRYTPYEWQATNGVDGTGCIYAGSQYFADAYGDYEDTYDLLVSPPIEGTVTVQAKRFNAIGSIGFYRVTRSGESLVRGEIIYPIGETSYGITELTNDWVTYTLPAQPAGTRIGIRLQQGYIDNFTAEAVDLNPQPGLGVTLVSPSVSTTIAANEDNTFTVNFVVSVKNTGDLDLTTATEGYSIELRKYNAGGTEPDDHTLVATLPITTNLAKGESLPEDLTISATLNVADYPAAATNGISFRIYENVSHTYASTKTITVIPYEPQFSLRIDNSNFTDGGTVNLGASKEASSKQVIIRSTGGAPLVINSVDVPTGFTTTLVPKTIPALTNDTIEVALDPTVPGAKQGAFVIHTNAGDATINLTGTTVSGNVFFADFESDASLDGLLVEKDGSGYYTYGWIVPYSSYGSSNSVARGYATSSSTPGPFKLILPKLKFEEGDALQFDVQKASSYTDANVTIYYSADRNEWTQLRRMAHDAEREADLLTTTSTTVTLQNIPAGEWYVAFEITYESEIYLDNIIGGQIVDVAHDVALSSTVLPENGTVNSKFVATTKAVNLKDDIAAGSYTARLYFGDEVVKELEAVALPKQQQVAFDFSFTPHAAGTYNARIELAFADGYTTSVSQEVTIAEEVYAALKTVGDGSSSQNASPFNYYYYKTQAENIYTADELAAQGITTGTTITKVAFYGFNTGKQVDYQAKLWISETSQDAFTIDEENSGWNDYYFTTGQENNAPQFDGVATLVSAGTIDNKVSLITFDLATPYVYQGGNLVVQTYGVCDVYPGSGLTYSSQRVSGVKSIVRRRDSGDFSATDYYSENTYRPDIRLGIEAEPNTVSGKVTDKVTGAAMAGVDVKAQNDEVLYGATTDTEGNYSFAILQDNQEYDLVVNKAGYFPHSEKVSVALGSEVRNIELTEAKGFLIESAELPAAGQVNYGYSATATATNYEARDFGAQTYTAELVFGEKVVATAPAVEVKAGETATFNFAFTPHEAGQFQAFVRFTEGENVATSDAIDVTIAEETAGGLVQVGDSTGRENYYPVNFYYNYSCSDIVYTPEMLNASGVVPGSQIQKVIFYVQAESPKTFDYTLTAWAGSVVYDSETYDPSTGHDQLTQVFDHATFTFSAPDASSVNPIRIPIELDLTANPILYDGTNSVRVAIEKQSSTYVGYAYFAQDNKYNTMWAKYNDYSEQLVSTLTKSGNQVQKVPVALFEVAAGATLSGT